MAYSQSTLLSFRLLGEHQSYARYVTMLKQLKAGKSFKAAWQAGFLVTMMEGQRVRNRITDTFRIKIWNQAIPADPSTVLGAGRVKIHKGQGVSGEDENNFEDFKDFGHFEDFGAYTVTLFKQGCVTAAQRPGRSRTSATRTRPGEDPFRKWTG